MTRHFIPFTGTDDRTRLARMTAMAWIIGGALWLGAGLVHDSSGWRFNSSSLLWLVGDVLIAGGLFGLLALRPHGGSRVGAIALGAAVAARVAFASGEIASLIEGHDDSPLLPIGAMVTAVAMTTYGVVVFRGGEVRGRVRGAFLPMGLYPFVGMFPVAAATGEPSSILIALWGLPAILIGTTCGSLTRTYAPPSGAGSSAPSVVVDAGSGA